jgi:hypothetical protein
MREPAAAADASVGAITVIIPTVIGDRPALERAVASARRHASRVIIVTQAAAEVSEELRRGLPPEVELLADDERGLSRARNIGLATVASDWVIFLDDDAELTDEFPRVVERLEGLRDHAVVTWRVRSSQGIDISRYADGDRPLSARNHWKLSREHGAIWRVEELRALGGFDDGFGLGRWAGSDEGADLMIRLLSSGRRGRYLDICASRHPASGADYVGKARSYGRGTGRLIRRHVTNPVAWPYAIRSVAGLVSVLLPARRLQSPRKAKPLRALGIVEGIIVPERFARRR